jgi:hypothetical protein
METVDVKLPNDPIVLTGGKGTQEKTGQVN